MATATDSTPTVTVGLPVYNGENFLADAVESVLGQTFADLQLVICDNASTDRTAEICAGFASRDRRVVYVRNERNLGAAPNYNRTFQLGSGRYFKWLAHDDRMEPAYLEQTVAGLEADPSAVLCNTPIDFIDSAGRKIATYPSLLAEIATLPASGRFAALVLRNHPCADIFSLFRRTALDGSLLHATFHGADRALLAQMALRGRMLQLKEPLFQMREHPARYTRMVASAKERRKWHDATGARVSTLPALRLYREYVHMVRTEALDEAERRRCYAVLARWWLANWNCVRVAVDFAALVAPGIVGHAESVKARLFGKAQGHFH
jgi:glycosyltransferase involved in cell wall biosynthesis